MKNNNVSDIKKLLGLDKYNMINNEIIPVDDDTKLYQVIGYNLPLKYSTLIEKGIPNNKIIAVIDRNDFRRELTEAREREKLEKERKEKERENMKIPF